MKKCDRCGGLFEHKDLFIMNSRPPFKVYCRSCDLKYINEMKKHEKNDDIIKNGYLKELKGED